MKKGLIKWLIPVLVLMNACKKNDTPAGPSVAPAKGVYVLSEGQFFGNDAKLGFYSFATNSFTGDFFVQQNPSISTGLGDLANDMIIYGGKMYIVVNNSNVVRVLNAKTAVQLSSISFVNGGTGRQPRSLAAVAGKIFVTSYDNTVSAIDTTSLAIVKTIPVGLNPEGITVSGDNLYVANSGGLSATFDSTVSVISLQTLTETRKIRVGINPYGIGADDAGNVYVSCIGNYGNIGPKLVKLNAGSGAITKSADTAVGAFKVYNNRLYVTGGYLGIGKVRVLNTTDFAAVSPDFITDGTVVAYPYGINVDEENGDVYVTDAKNFSSVGELFCFDKLGKKKFSVSVSPASNPSKVLFVR